MAVILATLGDTATCLQYYDRAIEINKELGDNLELTRNYLNKSIVLQNSGRYNEAKSLNLKALKLSKSTGSYLDHGEAAIEYACLLHKTGHTDSCYFYLNTVLLDTAFQGYKPILKDAYTQIAVCLLEEKKLNQAFDYAQKAYDMSKEAEDKEDESTASKILYKIYLQRGNYQKALKFYRHHKELMEQIQNMSNQKEILTREYQKLLLLQKEKDSLNASLAEEQSKKELLEKDLEITKSRNQIFYLSGAGIFALIVIFLLYRNNKQKQKDKEVILSQKEEITVERDKANENYLIAEEKKIQLQERNKEILDSIKYAKRLQEAVLPPQKLVKEWLTNSFIIYKPKEIVSGDFYWMETTTIKDSDKSTNITFFAAADCTGHGVPGAMVSVICAGALNRAVNEYKLSDVGEILNKVSEIVVESFKQSGERVADGMDIALCGLDIGRKKLFFTGANNPLWVITSENKLNTESTYKSFNLEDHPNRFLHEIKGTKQHIGLNDNQKEFQTSEVQLQPGDGIFVFSDGLADQFGGSRGKKFKYQQFREILIENFDQNMDQLRDIINEKFESWKGDMEQVDDICVIGVKINGKERNNFTKREIEVLEYLLEGLPSKLIADKMHISVHTVDTYRRRLLAKTNTYNTTELINYCKRKEIV